MLAHYGQSAKLLAGGQSLVPVLNSRLGRYEQIIDLNRIAELSYIRADGDCLQIGAMTRQRAIETSPLVARYAPLLTEVTKHIGHLPIRTRGTIGGSLAHADPAAEDPAAMLALDAEFDLLSAEGQRTVKATDFFEGPLQTALSPQEMLVGIRIPRCTAETTFAFEEFSRRPGDFAVVGIAALLTWDAGRIAHARLAVCGLSLGAIRLEAGEHELENQRATGPLLAKAAHAAALSIEPQADLHASAGYRRYLVEALTTAALERATSRLKSHV